MSDTDSSHNFEEEIPSKKAWGKKKSDFFGTDYVDKDFRRIKKDEEELADAEEEEALAAQKRILEEIDESDFDLNLDITFGESQSNQNENYHQVKIDIDSLSKKEKLDFLKKDSPEIIHYVKKFKQLMKELDQRLKIFLSHSNCDDISMFHKSASFLLYQAKYHCILRYCVNICLYLSFKSSLVSMKNHPILETLKNFKEMLLKLQKLEKSSYISKEFKLFWSKIKNDDTIRIKQKAEKRKIKANVEPIKRVHFDDTLDLRPISANQNDEDENDVFGAIHEDEEEEGLGLRLKSKKRETDYELKEYEKDYGDLREESEDEKEFNLFLGDEDEDEEVDGEQKLMKALDDEIERRNTQDENDFNDDDDDDDDDDVLNDRNLLDKVGDKNLAVNEKNEKIKEQIVKRPINYQISKNKGLTPKRKKEYRNPRVKNRNKYRKAKIRRKGAVREYRKEIQKYSGEISGIKSDTVKSLKYK